MEHLHTANFESTLPILKPRRSLYKLRLKFVQTTAEVSRKYYVLTNLSARTHLHKYT